MRISTIGALLCLASTVTVARPALGQGAPLRDGFWANAASGGGTMGCTTCTERATGPIGTLIIGGHMGDMFLMGAGVTGWTTSEYGTTSVVLLQMVARLYVAKQSGLYFALGGGLGVVGDALSSFGDGSEIGAGGLFGMGYDLRVGGNFSLTPFWSIIAVKTENADVNVIHAGLGITIH